MSSPSAFLRFRTRLLSPPVASSLAFASLIAVPTALVAACGSDDDQGAPVAKDGGLADATSGADGGPAAVAPTQSYARFTLPTDALPSFLDVPFPSDVYLGANHFITAAIPGVNAVIPGASTPFLTHELAKENGFSRISPALFWIDDASTSAPATIDTTSLPANETACSSATSSVFLVDLSESGASALLPCRAKYHDDAAAGATRPGLGIGPARGYVLAEGHSYAAVLTSRVKDSAGHGLQASVDFQNAASGSRSDANAAVYQSAIAKVKAALASALATDGATVVAIAPYTTSNMSGQMYTLRDTVEAEAAPKLAWDAPTVAPMVSAKFAAGTTAPTGFTATLDAWLGSAPAKLPDGTDDPDFALPQIAHDKLAAVGTAVFLADNYLQNTVSADAGASEALDNATFNLDGQGNIIADPVTPKAKIWATIAIPQGTMPAGGWPVVIAQHGLGQSRSFIMTLANTYATRGWATVAIDSVTFGARAPEAKFQVDATNTFAAYPAVTYTGPDGFADLVGFPPATNGATDFFGGLQNIGAIRDQFRQAMMDAVELVKMVRGNPDLSPLTTTAGTPKFDPTQVVYLGNSLGAMEAVGAAALEPNVKAWGLNVAGGGIFTELAAHGPTIAASLHLAADLYFGIGADSLDEAHPFVVLCQNLVEPGDPLEFAANLVQAPHTLKGAATSARNVLQVEVIYDELVSNEANEALARAAGFGLATPNVGSNAGVTSLMSPTDPTTQIGAVPLATVNPGSDGTIHDTPMAGITAVLVQQSPGEHGANLVESVSDRSWAIPYYTAAGMNSFVAIAVPNPVTEANGIPCSYRQIQSTFDGFFSSALAGHVPTVAGFLAPVRDADGDGSPDATDPAPLDPTKK